VEKTKGMEIRNHKEKSLGKTETKIEKFNQNPFPKTLSLIFQTLTKTPNVLFNLNPKTYFDCSKNT